MVFAVLPALLLFLAMSFFFLTSWYPSTTPHVGHFHSDAFVGGPFKEREEHWHESGGRH